MKRLIILLVVIFSSGCAIQPLEKPNDPNYAPVQPASLLPPQINDGSIYRAGFATDLWMDQRARRVGDAITIVLSESTTSSKSNSASITKDTSVTAANPTIMGLSPNFHPSKILSSGDGGVTLENNIDSASDFSGAADAGQKNSLKGQITVTVSEVLPNGLLRVRGEKWLMLSKGEEFIRITGLIRPSDISTSNTVASTQIADARITYSGRGDLADANNPGWVTKFLNGRFWPF
jgi:flagellar L-ring protein precursor FlgH